MEPSMAFSSVMMQISLIMINSERFPLFNQCTLLCFFVIWTNLSKDYV